MLCTGTIYFVYVPREFDGIPDTKASYQSSVCSERSAPRLFGHCGELKLRHIPWDCFLIFLVTLTGGERGPRKLSDCVHRPVRSYLLLTRLWFSTDNYYICSITATLVSRFLLELQEANRMVVRLDPDDPLHSSRNFSDDTSSFISSLGACINPGLTMSRDDDYEPYAGARSDEEQEGGARVSQVAASSSPA